MGHPASQTTETLRATLLNAISGVLAGTVEARAALAVAKLADQVLKSAELEIKYTKHLQELDDSNSGLSPGPLLLASKK